MSSTFDETKYRRAMRDYVTENEPLLVRAVARRPGAFASLVVASRTPEWKACSDTNLHKAREHGRAASLHALLTLAAKPSWKNLLEIERACHKNHGLMDGWSGGPSGLFELACNVFEVELPRRPAPPGDEE